MNISEHHSYLWLDHFLRKKNQRRMKQKRSDIMIQWRINGFNMWRVLDLNYHSKNMRTKLKAMQFEKLLVHFPTNAWYFCTRCGSCFQNKFGGLLIIQKRLSSNHSIWYLFIETKEKNKILLSFKEYLNSQPCYPLPLIRYCDYSCLSYTEQSIWNVERCKLTVNQ